LSGPYWSGLISSTAFPPNSRTGNLSFCAWAWACDLRHLSRFRFGGKRKQEMGNLPPAGIGDARAARGGFSISFLGVDGSSFPLSGNEAKKGLCTWLAWVCRRLRFAIPLPLVISSSSPAIDGASPKQARLCLGFSPPRLLVHVPHSHACLGVHPLSRSCRRRCGRL